MAKNKRGEEIADSQEEMTLEEARAFRASLAQPKKAAPMGDSEKREEFRKYWAMNKGSYGQGKDVESIIWTHLKAIKMDDPSRFDEGLKHFGLEKIK